MKRFFWMLTFLMPLLAFGQSASVKMIADSNAVLNTNISARLSKAGGTVTGPTAFQAGLTASSVTATGTPPPLASSGGFTFTDTNLNTTSFLYTNGSRNITNIYDLGGLWPVAPGTPYAWYPRATSTIASVVHVFWTSGPVSVSGSSSSGGSSLNATTIVASTTTTIADWSSFNQPAFILTTNTAIIFTNTSRFTNQFAVIAIQQDTNGNRSLTWSNASGAVRTNQSIALGSTNANAKELFLAFPDGTNIVIWPVNGLQTNVPSFSAGIGFFGGVQLQSTNPAYVSGGLYFDTNCNCLTFFNTDTNVSLQVGQEAWIRVMNISGITITNGKAVYLDSSTNGVPTVKLAQANVARTARVLGLATEDITNGAIGFVTTYGIVNGLNTTNWTNGSKLFLSSLLPGELTNRTPGGTNIEFSVGQNAFSNSTSGKIFVAPSVAFPEQDQIFDLTTTDGTTNSLAVFLPPNNSVVNYYTRVVSTTRGGTNASAGYIRSATVRTTNNTCTILGTVTSIASHADVPAWTCTFDVTGGTVRIRVGTASGTTTNDWRARVSQTVYP